MRAFPGSELWIVACHLTTLPKMKYAWFRCMHVSAQTELALELPTRWHLFLLLRGVSEICVSFFTQQMDSPQRWQSLLSAVGTHESIQEAIITRGCISASVFAFGITASDALEQLVQDILFNTEALESTSGVTAANANISPRAASIRRAWHGSWALCHGTSSNQQWTTDLHGSDAPPLRPTLETQSELRYGRHSGQIVQENCSTQTALQASGIGHWSTTP